MGDKLRRFMRFPNLGRRSLNWEGGIGLLEALGPWCLQNMSVPGVMRRFFLVRAVNIIKQIQFNGPTMSGGADLHNFP